MDHSKLMVEAGSTGLSKMVVTMIDVGFYVIMFVQPSIWLPAAVA